VSYLLNERVKKSEVKTSFLTKLVIIGVQLDSVK